MRFLVVSFLVFTLCLSACDSASDSLPAPDIVSAESTSDPYIALHHLASLAVVQGSPVVVTKEIQANGFSGTLTLTKTFASLFGVDYYQLDSSITVTNNTDETITITCDTTLDPRRSGPGKPNPPAFSAESNNSKSGVGAATNVFGPAFIPTGITNSFNADIDVERTCLIADGTNLSSESESAVLLKNEILVPEDQPLPF